MTWTYSGDPSSSPRNELRYLIGDTDTADKQVQDEELDYHLTKNGNNAVSAAIDACEALAAKYARRVNREVGDLRIESERLMDHYIKLAKRLQKNKSIRGAAGIFIGNDPQQRLFSMGMMDETPRDTSYDGRS